MVCQAMYDDYQCYVMLSEMVYELLFPKLLNEHYLDILHISIQCQVLKNATVVISVTINFIPKRVSEV